MASLLSLLGLKTDSSPATDSDTIRRIAAELDKLDEAHATYVAAFAYLLSRVAGADHEVTADETATMERLVREKGHLAAGQATLVVQMARTQQRLFGGTDDFLVARELARAATYEQKVALVDCLFAVAAADRRILNTEADEIGRIARELKVEQSDLSRIRASYREHLEARRGLVE
jgi:uncharacterized tellurite resistance protein B-like protein